jgi:phosphoheptose isomerase
MLNFENIGDRFLTIASTEEWKALQQKFNDCDDIYVLGHGGNLAVADHAAVDITRLSNGTKNAMCPGSAIVATSFINDSSFDQWMVNWLSCRTSTRTKNQMKKSLVLGISSSGGSMDVLKALQWADDHGMQIAVITSKDIPVEIQNLTKVILGARYYHTAEVLTLLLTYQLTHGSGNVCPPIGENSPEDLERMNWKGGKIREHSYPDEKINIGIDFDGVIHKCSKGYYDGTIYDDPVEGTYEALQRLSRDYTIIINTCKAKPDRGLVNGKTGTALVWEWLEKHDMAKFVSKVTSEKPRARVYIDDKAIRFDDWGDAIESMETHGIIVKYRGEDW